MGILPRFFTFAFGHQKFTLTFSASLLKEIRPFVRAPPFKDFILSATRSLKKKKSKVQSKMEERCANDYLEEFGPADDVDATQQTDAEVLEGVI